MTDSAQRAATAQRSFDSTEAGEQGPRRPVRLPAVVWTLALGVFLMGTTEFLAAGLLPGIAADMDVSVAQAGLSITVFAVGMIVGAPAMSAVTLRIPQTTTLVLALLVFAIGHVIGAVAPSFAILLAARFGIAVATGAFWAVAAVVATRSAGPAASARAMGIVNAGGMLATVIGVPLGALAGQLFGWRTAFAALAVLAAAAAVLVAKTVPTTATGSSRRVSLRAELALLASARLWLALAACAGATGGTLAAYSFITPLLTDRAGLPTALVPLVLAGFGIGSLVGSVVGGRLGDSRPSAIIVIAPVVTIVILLGLCLVAGAAVPTAILVCLLGLFGLGANPVLIAVALRFAGSAPTLASSLAVAAFNAGTAVASWAGGMALETRLGETGPLLVGAAIAAIALIPVIVLARTLTRSRSSH